MPILRTYACPDCGGRFEHLHMTRDEPPPGRCELCGNSMTDPEPELSAPHIAGVAGKSGDMVYRAMEESSAARAAEAAALTGGDASDFSAVKITDMADRLRPGDVAAKLPPSPVASVMAQAPNLTGFQGAAAAAGYAASTRSGYAPGMGNMTRSFVGDGHLGRASRMTAAGQMNAGGKG